MWLAACTGATDTTKAAIDRDQAVLELQRLAGSPVTLEVGGTGDARVLAMTPRFPVPGHATDPAIVATDFLAAHHDVFQLDVSDATQFAVASVDNDRTTGLHHVTLNRTFNGIPVFQGAITVHMDSGKLAVHLRRPQERLIVSRRPRHWRNLGRDPVDCS